jgi:signal transduction histidine kinase
MAARDQPFLDSGRMGLVVLNRDHSIEACYGKLVEGLRPGPKATEAMPILIGLDDILTEIMAGELNSFFLPRVSLHEADERVLSLEIVRADEPGRLHVVLRDETEIAALEQEVIQKRNELSLTHAELAKARDRAEQALREKAAVLANVSHDLKSPLQVIMGNAEILKGDLPLSEREAYLQDILENSNFLLNLITDLLDASALEADQMQLDEEPIDLARMLQRILSVARQLPGGEARRFDLAMDERKVVVMGDSMRLQRLLLNLLSNALKFTGDDGHIEVSVRRSAKGDLLLEVRDDGCGIEPTLLSRVFEPFTRSGSAEGMGLGLHIAKALANLHDADLALNSKVGKGTTATFLLPSARVIEKPR